MNSFLLQLHQNHGRTLTWSDDLHSGLANWWHYNTTAGIIIVISVCAMLLLTLIFLACRKQIAASMHRRSHPMRVVALTEDIAVSPQIVEVERGTIYNPPIPIKDSSKFGGWFYDYAMTQPFSPAKRITEDTTLYAKWIEEGK